MENYLFAKKDKKVNLPVELISAGIENRNSNEYCFDNTKRDFKGYIFQYTLSGYGIVEINKKEYKLTQNSGFFVKIPSDTKYYCDNNNPWSFVYIRFESDCLESLLNNFQGVFKFDESNFIIKQLFEILDDCKNKTYSYEELSVQVYSFICKLYSDLFGESKKFSPVVAKAKNIMDNEFKNINITEIAGVIGVSRNHLARCFAEETGISPICYLQNVRLNYSLKLLASTSLSVKEIAEKCGFSTANYYTKSFFKKFNKTPSKFRKEYLKQLKVEVLLS